MVMQFSVSASAGGRKDAVTLPLGLPAEDRDELRELFRWYAAKVGWRSGYASFESSCFGLGSHTNDVHQQMAELVDSHTIRDATRVMRTLNRMTERGQTLEVTVLFCLYGEPPPHSRDLLADFGELAPIAHLTPAVEEERERLALQEGLTRDRKLTATYQQDLEEAREQVTALFWDAAWELGELDQQPPGARQRRMALGWREVQRRAIAEYEALGKRAESQCLSSRLSAMASADKELTPLDGLSRLRYRGKRDARGRPNKDAYAAWKLGRVTFVSQVRTEAHRLRIRAARAYMAAKGDTE